MALADLAQLIRGIGATDPRSPFMLLTHLETRFGLIGTASIMAELALRLLRGEPFAKLPPAASAAERASRRQAAPAFVLYRVLARRGVADPFEATAAVVELAGVHFLRRALGPLEPETFAAMDPTRRDAWIARRAASFPNATPVFEEVSSRAVRFRIHACRFVTLAQQIGEPHLATLFCRADEAYFGKVEPHVTLVRPHTLARGGPDCPFELRFTERAPSTGSR
jgi:hypothetical protein